MLGKMKGLENLAALRKLAPIMESIHARLELMNEQQGKILDVLEKKHGIKGEYKENIAEDTKDTDKDV